MIEVNKLISTLQDNVQSRVVDPQSVVMGLRNTSGPSSGAYGAFYVTRR